VKVFQLKIFSIIEFYILFPCSLTPIVVTFNQLKTCECCSVNYVRELPVELVCDDNYKFIKNINIPESCSCSKCGADEFKLSKLKAAF
jgi:hypothetical protein